MWYSDKLDELKESSNIGLDEEIYIIPFHLLDRKNSFDDLKLVRIYSIETNGRNTRGCEVTGVYITYDTKGQPIETIYCGHAIYRYKAGAVITQNGKRWPVITEDGTQELTDKPPIYAYTRFLASVTGDEGKRSLLSVEVPITFGIPMQNSKDAIEYAENHPVCRCLLYPDRLECVIDGRNVVFSNYSVVSDDVIFDSEKSKRELWDHMVVNEKAWKENEYGMAFSKSFLLRPVCNVARLATGEILRTGVIRSMVNAPDDNKLRLSQLDGMSNKKKGKK